MKKSNNFFVNWKIRIICFVLACLVYFVVATSSQAERRVSLPVNLIMPSNYEAVSNLPKKVDLLINGTEDQIYMVDINKIQLKADFSQVKTEGVSVVPVEIEFEDAKGIIDFSNVTIHTDPSEVKIYFSKKAN